MSINSSICMSKPLHYGTIRLVLVDDRAPFRDAFAQLLEKQPDLAVIRQVEDAESLPKLLAALRTKDQPDLLVIDVEMRSDGGVEATREFGYSRSLRDLSSTWSMYSP